ncbi:MAG TPA: putative DNA-binding domain-containing protein [Gammaproteobacteria bacterium]
MVELPEFQQRQYAFAAHIRDPQHAPRPADVPAPRMAVYGELIFNNIDSFLTDMLPVLHGLLDTAHWQALVRDFLVAHRARSPYFLDIPREFLSYLDTERAEHPPEDFRDPPFLRELAHYEWVELALSVDDRDVDAGAIDPDDDLLDGHPVLSPLAWPLQYAFPVHRIRADYQPAEPPETPTFLLVYRDAEDTVRFLELNPVSARLIGLLAEHADDAGYSGRQALGSIAAELRHPQPEQVVAHGLDLLRDWRARGILLGASIVTT